MRPDDVLKEFEEAGALLKGHFVLSSGLRSDTYLNKSIVSMYPARTERLCRALAETARAALPRPPQCVIAPAMGAIIYGYETARHLGVPSMFVERVDGQFELRRGFEIGDMKDVLIVEDIVSTGLSAQECVDAVVRCGGAPMAVACLIDRSNGAAELSVPLVPLASIEAKAWRPDDLPPHLADIPPVKPGSRGVSQ